ncbi:MAG TPA: hypothetical protein DCS28_02350 [Candidatus Moranbacteria bacterium]|nr:hypothetical protein [Candidatus Moranbacteria bacterium]HAT74855.1 hypothetical protein [Candidatus Moranbacteria bacterium]
MFFSGFLKINKIEISGLEKLEEMSVRNIIENKITGKFFQAVEKNNLILFNKRGAKKTLLENFKRIEDARIEKFFPDVLKIIIKERKLTMLFYSGEICHILNEKGEPYLAENFSAEELEKENLIALNDLSGTLINLDANPLESDFQKFALNIASKVLDDTGIILKKNYETPSRMSGDLRAETEEGWKIFFGASVGLEKEALMLKAVLDNKIEKERRKDLEYIDLRIDNKVFYKFMDGTQQETQSTQGEEISPVVEKKDEKKKKK